MPPITSLLLAGAVVLTGAVATAPPAGFSRFAAAVSRLQESMISAAKAADLRHNCLSFPKNCRCMSRCHTWRPTSTAYLAPCSSSSR